MGSWRKWLCSPAGCEIAQRFWPSADLLELRDAHTAESDIRVHLYYQVKIVLCVLEDVWWKGWGVDLLMWVVLNYRACLLLNRSAERVMPQPMSQPSCIIAPVCHCQRLGKASSDCFLPLSPSPPPHLFLSPLQSLFSLDSLAYPAEADRLRQSKSEHIEYPGGDLRGPTVICVQGFYLTTSAMSRRWRFMLLQTKRGFPWRIMYEAMPGRRRCRAAAGLCDV